MEVYNVDSSEEAASYVSSSHPSFHSSNGDAEEYEDDVGGSQEEGVSPSTSSSSDDGQTSQPLHIAGQGGQRRISRMLAPKVVADAAAQCDVEVTEPYVHKAMAALLASLGASPLMCAGELAPSSIDADNSIRTMRRVIASIPTTQTSNYTGYEADSSSAADGTVGPSPGHQALILAMKELCSVLSSSSTRRAVLHSTTRPTTTPLPDSSTEAAEVLQRLFHELASHMSVSSRSVLAQGVSLQTVRADHSAPVAAASQYSTVYPELERILRIERVQSITPLYKELLALRGQVGGANSVEKLAWARSAMDATGGRILVELKYLEEQRRDLFHRVTHRCPGEEIEALQKTLAALCEMGSKLRVQQAEIERNVSSARPHDDVQRFTSPRAQTPQKISSMCQEDIKALRAENLLLSSKLRVLEERAERAERCATEAVKSFSVPSQSILERISAKLDGAIVDQRASDIKAMGRVASLLIGRSITAIEIDGDVSATVRLKGLDGQVEDIALQLAGDELPMECAINLAQQLVDRVSAQRELLSTTTPSRKDPLPVAEIEETTPAPPSIFYSGDDFESSAPDSPVRADEPTASTNATLTDSVGVIEPPQSVTVHVNEDIVHEDVPMDYPTTFVQDDGANNEDQCGDRVVDPLSPLPMEMLPGQAFHTYACTRKRSRSVSPMRSREVSPRLERQPTASDAMPPSAQTVAHIPDAPELSIEDIPPSDINEAVAPCVDAREDLHGCVDAVDEKVEVNEEPSQGSNIVAEDIDEVAKGDYSSVPQEGGISPQEQSHTTSPEDVGAEAVNGQPPENLFAEDSFWED